MAGGPSLVHENVAVAPSRRNLLVPGGRREGRARRAQTLVRRLGRFLGGAVLAENASLRFSARLAGSDVHERLLRAEFASRGAGRRSGLGHFHCRTLPCTKFSLAGLGSHENRLV
jgi:hypothetical protein